MMSRHGTLNVHPVSCVRAHPIPCEPWAARLPRLVAFLRDAHCSTWSLQGCEPAQAVDVAAALRWSTCVVGVGDLALIADASWSSTGDGSRCDPPALWLPLRHSTGALCWFGSARLVVRDRAARKTQAQQLAASWPAAGDGLRNAILGVDRNSFTRAQGQPRDVWSRAGVREALPTNPARERSYHGFGAPDNDGKSIDGLHYSGPGVLARSAALLSTAGKHITDHSALTLAYTITGD